MNQKPCQFYSFLQAVRGNWRNALVHPLQRFTLSNDPAGIL